MNMQQIPKLEPIARNYSLENELDCLLATQLLQVQSIRVYLDVLDVLRKKFNEKPALHTARNLASYMRNPNIKLDLHSHVYQLDSRQLAYLDEIVDYTKMLQASLNVNNTSPWGTVDLTIGNIEALVSRQNASNDEIIKFMHSRLAAESDIEIAEFGCNIEVRFSHPLTTIYLVRTWDNFNLPMSRHSASLIVCTTDLSLAPDNIFVKSDIRSISYLNHLGSFERIHVFSPIHQCIAIVGATIRQLNIKHVELVELIKGMGNLLGELESISLITHKAIEPEGNLVLTGVKNCLLCIKPLIKMIAELPDSRTIRTTKVRLEQISFTLASFFTNLSTRLNTKKYIIESLGMIIKNDGLYKLKQKPRLMEHAFHEENLNTILASSLACFYHNRKDIDVQTEVPIGSGFADIVVKYEKNISAIIEGKLVKKLNEAKSKVAEGLNQLYNRYGDHNSILDAFGVELYLVLFAYDQNLNSLSEATLEEVAKFSERHSINLQTHMEGRGYLHFSFIDKRLGSGLPPKKRSIFIFYCNMEVVKKDEPDYRVNKKS
ncbi:hypothetical protein [Pseudomonas rhodesiae]|uniref:hypothetical protein n=1 Tax=Pseudomonas rhodesiae TaxID=76760 RepID=UPI001F2DA322|nr:hypothetical protein [Pseudomonas rhodesiae]